SRPTPDTAPRNTGPRPRRTPCPKAYGGWVVVPDRFGAGSVSKFGRIGTQERGVPRAKEAASMLDDRKLEVLRAIVEDYVQTHEPVGSKALVERHKLGVS